MDVKVTTKVTLSLDEYDAMRDEIKGLKRQLVVVDNALKTVHNTTRDALCERASDIEHSKNRAQLIEAIRLGQF